MITDFHKMRTNNTLLPPRTKFSDEEDKKLIQLVNSYPKMTWKQISVLMGNRTSRQCRERYNNYLSPDLNHNPWTPEEDALLLQKYKELGPQWAFMTQFFNRRACVDIKNHYAKISNINSLIAKQNEPKSDTFHEVHRTKFILPSINMPTENIAQNDAQNKKKSGTELKNHNDIIAQRNDTESAFLEHKLTNLSPDAFWDTNNDDLFNPFDFQSEIDNIYPLVDHFNFFFM